MAVITVSDTATSYDLPNYVGELFERRRRSNALIRLIGGLTGQIRTVTNTEFPLGVGYEIPDGAQPSILEGADPTPAEIGTSQGSNVVQIFQYAVGLTYSRMGETGEIGGVSLAPGDGNGPLTNPGSLEWQIDRKLEQLQNDANFTFLQGTYALPGDNLSARQTRGIINAVSTNLFDNGGTGRPLDKTIFEDALKSMVDGGYMQQGEEVFVLGSAARIEDLAKLYEADGRQPESREEVGVAVRTIHTFWATAHLVHDQDVPSDKLVLARPQFMRVTALSVPSKGLIFVEPLARTGSAEKNQLYAELGLDYVDEALHGLIDDLN